MLKVKQESNDTELLNFQLDGTYGVGKEVFGFEAYKKHVWSSKVYGRFMIFKIR
jgi:hypothetical protein